ncbi:Peptide upstream ORF protein [Heracleum sosnowskyi]|uniref:Peptide upstream ORF protein n=1 Tax=Heracleum sosnowskyi TaxID=360622 RepID=A0AAD8IJ51_9APIA|nr:Peptide upstream ORF protein [Heracleum sosnowskyi]
MDLARGVRAKKNKMNVKDLGDVGGNYDGYVIINLPDSVVLRVVSRSLLLAIFVITLPLIGYISGRLAGENVVDVTGFKYFPEIFQDLVYEGLVKMGDKGLILSSGVGHPAKNLQFLYSNEVELVVESDLNGKSSFQDESFDIVFSSSLEGSKKLTDRILRAGGIVVMELGNGPAYEFQRDPNYKVVYLRRLDVTVLAMRKADHVNQAQYSGVTRKLFEAKKDALRGLEDVWLEPPRRALAESNKLRTDYRFLPDLMGDSLENYPRRVFITDEKTQSVEWFKQNYPTRNQDFQIYNLDMEMNYEETVAKGSVKNEVPFTSGVSNWMANNVKKEDYVVMKAEAEMVEEMMSKKMISLVDELFLECRNQWQDGSKSKRAYWQCLALYGKLRDEGIAVHQWLN